MNRTVAVLARVIPSPPAFTRVVLCSGLCLCAQLTAQNSLTNELTLKGS